MRTRTLLSTTAVAGLVAAGMFAGQGTASAGSAHTLRAKEKITKTAPEDFGKNGVKMGDHLAFTSEVKDLTGKKLGISGGDCVVFAGDTADNAKFHCTETLDLGGDQIFTGGIFTYAEKTGRLVIMGGTGRYRGATGELDYQTVSADTFDDTFHFTS